MLVQMMQGNEQEDSSGKMHYKESAANPVVLLKKVLLPQWQRPCYTVHMHLVCTQLATKPVFW